MTKQTVIAILVPSAAVDLAGLIMRLAGSGPVGKVGLLMTMAGTVGLIVGLIAKSFWDAQKQ